MIEINLLTPQINASKLQIINENNYESYFPLSKIKQHMYSNSIVI